jgi:hypothetical protein
VNWVAQSVYCLTTDWTAGVRTPTEAANVSPSFCIQTGSGAHPDSRTVATGGSLRGKAWLGRDADHSPLLGLRLRKSRRYITSPPKYLHGVQRDHFTFYQLIKIQFIIILFVVRLCNNAFSSSLLSSERIISEIMNWKGCEGQRSWLDLRCHLIGFIKGLSKTTKYFSDDSRSLSRDFNLRPE